MRVLLHRGLPEVDLTSLVGKPVHATAGGRIVGKVVGVEHAQDCWWGELELDAAFLPHELGLEQLSINRIDR